MLDYERGLNEHYGRAELGSKILSALLCAGTDIGSLRHNDLEALDQFHIGGMGETRNLAEIAGLQDNMRVLDVGGGIGGPARTLAAELGCQVTGLDLTLEFVRAADMLTKRVGLSDRVEFRHGNALDMPFEDAAFDAVWMQHVTMNIEDKGQLLREARRVLRPVGRLALYEICRGPDSSPLQFPVPWADRPELSFLVSPDEMDDLAASAGFTNRTAIDKTDFAVQWFEGMFDKAPPALGLGVISPDFPAKAANVAHAVQDDRLRVIQRVFER